MNIYLAIPYSGMEELSFKIANEVASKLMAEGHVVYSPISHNHPIAKAHGLPTTWEFWEKFDTEFVKWADVLVLTHIHGLVSSDIELIVKSKGVQAEMGIAKELKKEIKSYHYQIAL